MKEKLASHEPPQIFRITEDVVGCKWTLCVINLVRNGINRPGAMERSIAGLTQKVLNERLRKLIRFNILEKKSYPEVPPRVEYSLTAFGRKFIAILDQMEKLQHEVE